MQSLDEIGLKYGTDKASSHHGYLSVYERVLSQETDLSSGGAFLELGWWDGASMRMWRDWLDARSWPITTSEDPLWTVVGVDMVEKDPILGATFVQSDQASTTLPSRLLDIPGCEDGFDVIVDDASHVSPLTIASLLLLWPTVKPGGLYFVEDLQVSYHRDWAGNPHPDRPGPAGRTVMQVLRRVADDVHYGHASAGPDHVLLPDVAHVAFWPGLCLIQKKR